MEDVLHTIKDLYRKQDTAFKFNISFAYLLKKPIYGEIINPLGSMPEKSFIIIGYEYNYFSAQYNNRLFGYPETIDNNTTLNKVLLEVEKKLKEDSDVSYPSTEWIRFLHHEIVVFKLQSTIGYPVSLPLHFCQGSNEKNVVKFENLKIIFVFGVA